MYEQIDGILTCRDLSRAGSAGFRQPLALCSSTWPLCTSTWALQTDLWSHETSKRPPGPILDKNTVK